MTADNSEAKKDGLVDDQLIALGYNPDELGSRMQAIAEKALKDAKWAQRWEHINRIEAAADRLENLLKFIDDGSEDKWELDHE